MTCLVGVVGSCYQETMAKTAKRSSKKRRGPGRPPTTGIGKLIGIRCHKEFLKRVDRWRADHEGISRPQAIRRLAEMGLAAVDE
jgi:hypothetical protein